MYLDKQPNTKCLLKSLFQDKVYPNLQPVKELTYSVCYFDESNHGLT